jgi:AcrR family transcriptional regulator
VTEQAAPDRSTPIPVRTTNSPYAGAASSQEPRDPPPAQQARSRITRQRVLQAGTALLEEGGTEALTVGAVANRAGVAVGSVYRRFGDKDRLLAALQGDFVDHFRADIIRRFNPVRAEPAALIIAAVTGLVETYQEHQCLMRVFMVAGPSDEAVARMGSEASIDAGHVFRQFLEPVVPFACGPDPELRLDFVYRLVHSTCANHVIVGERFVSARPLSWRRLTEELCTIACLYLLGKPPATT